MVANLFWADPLQYFGFWGGSINQLGNGNVEFDLNDPIIPPSAGVASQVEEITQTANPQVVWQMDITPSHVERLSRLSCPQPLSRSGLGILRTLGEFGDAPSAQSLEPRSLALQSVS